jgi:hypothetical protein
MCCRCACEGSDKDMYSVLHVRVVGAGRLQAFIPRFSVGQNMTFETANLALHCLVHTCFKFWTLSHHGHMLRCLHGSKLTLLTIHGSPECVA